MLSADSNGLVWRRCESSSCVEVAEAEAEILVRNSRDQEGPRLSFTKREWAEFVTGVRAGRFDFD